MRTFHSSYFLSAFYLSSIFYFFSSLLSIMSPSPQLLLVSSSTALFPSPTPQSFPFLCMLSSSSFSSSELVPPRPVSAAPFSHHLPLLLLSLVVWKIQRSHDSILCCYPESEPVSWLCPASLWPLRSGAGRGSQSSEGCLGCWCPLFGTQC